MTVDATTFRSMVALLGKRPGDLVVTHFTQSAYCRDLLPGWYEDWVLAERDGLQHLRLRALEEVAEVLLRRGRCSEALDAALAAVRRDPLRESTLRLVLRIHVAEGKRVEALRHLRASVPCRLEPRRLLRHQPEQLDHLQAGRRSGAGAEHGRRVHLQLSQGWQLRDAGDRRLVQQGAGVQRGQQPGGPADHGGTRTDRPRRDEHRPVARPTREVQPDDSVDPVQNTGPFPAGPFFVEWRLHAADKVFNPTAFVNGLNPGESRTVTLEGTYFDIGNITTSATADVYNSVVEPGGRENNNTLTKAITVVPPSTTLRVSLDAMRSYADGDSGFVKGTGEWDDILFAVLDPTGTCNVFGQSIPGISCRARVLQGDVQGRSRGICAGAGQPRQDGLRTGDDGGAEGDDGQVQGRGGQAAERPAGHLSCIARPSGEGPGATTRRAPCVRLLA